MLLVSESYIDATAGVRLGDCPPSEPFTDNLGRLFRYGQREFGRCVSKVYVDTETGPKACGWVFQRAEKYEDCDRTYVREIWVTLHDAPDTVSRTPHFHFIP